jgi:hypothetical protein
MHGFVRRSGDYKGVLAVTPRSLHRWHCSHIPIHKVISNWIGRGSGVGADGGREQVQNRSGLKAELEDLLALVGIMGDRASIHS